MAGTTEKALQYLTTLPRVGLGNIKPLPHLRKKRDKHRRGRYGRVKGRSQGGQKDRRTLPRLGFEGGQKPFYLKMPQEPYYAGHHVKRQYPPISLFQLQRLIDVGRVDPEEPIDLTALAHTFVQTLNPMIRHHYGYNLTDEGADIFAAKVNIEVQHASELTIAAIERNGGVILTKFYDKACVEAMIDPVKFFSKGFPIPKCKLPPQDAVEYYTSATNRGYLADPEKIKEARIELAQKYGYCLPDISKDPLYAMLMRRKDPRQIWYGLSPGWLVDMKNKQILKPKDQDYVEYYKS